jgi:hypothetical protein
MSSRKLRAAAPSWAPRYPSIREGLPATVAAMAASQQPAEPRTQSPA